MLVAILTVDLQYFAQSPVSSRAGALALKRHKAKRFLKLLEYAHNLPAKSAERIRWRQNEGDPK
jgi:hypothetical protein